MDLAGLMPDSVAAPVSMEQRITAKLQGFKDRLSALERRSATSVGDGPPDASIVAPQGSRYLDRRNRRMYVYSVTAGWIATDAARAIGFIPDGLLPPASAGKWTDYGGPSVSLYVPAPGMVAVQADVECFAAQDSSLANISWAAVGLQFPGGTIYQTMQSGTINTWVRLQSIQTLKNADPNGNAFPNGGLILFHAATAGTVTFKLYYAAVTQAGVGTTIGFRNRRLWAAVL